MDRTFIMLKPDAIERNLIGEILARFCRAGFSIQALSMTRLTPEVVDCHYADHVGKTFYPALREFTLSGPIVRVILAKSNAIADARALLGATDSAKASPGTIRGDLNDGSGIVRRNLVHASDSPAAAEYEIGLHFPGPQ